jgi:YVTN family beta-propeller protein
MILYYYLNELYIAIAVDVSSQIEIINATSLKSIKQIPLFNGTIARAPRHLEYFNHYLYSINFDGTVSVIDLSTNSIIHTINCGLNPDNSVIVNGKLYVVNSGGLNSPTYDNTISVIDLNSNSILESFETAINCSSIVIDDEQDLYLISRGDYDNIDPKLIRINSTTNTVIETFEIAIGGMTYHHDLLYYYDYEQKGIYTFNTATETFISGQLIDCSSFQNFYGIQIDPDKELIYLVDANNYVTSSTVRSYDLLGNFKSEFYSGLNTGKLLFK